MMNNIRKESDEVLYSEDEYISLNNKNIEWLKGLCAKNSSGKIRLCNHRSIKDNLHEMLIVHSKNCYVRPHKHINQIESMSVLEGEADYIIFDDNGNVTKVLKMGEKVSGKVFYNRIDKPKYHMLIIRSDYLVFHEITNGPLDRSKTIFPDWAPKKCESNFMEKINNSILKFEK